MRLLEMQILKPKDAGCKPPRRHWYCIKGFGCISSCHSWPPTLPNCCPSSSRRPLRGAYLHGYTSHTGKGLRRVLLPTMQAASAGDLHSAAAPAGTAPAELGAEQLPSQAAVVQAAAPVLAIGHAATPGESSAIPIGDCTALDLQGAADEPLPNSSVS
mmetsp:Transcript_2715/g.7666  ORF Transcript_2715/g.7666 Transcript_2715/m.7666 type:complete len:158 (+) Transcript_2715:296-769(+)